MSGIVTDKVTAAQTRQFVIERNCPEAPYGPENNISASRDRLPIAVWVHAEAVPDPFCTARCFLVCYESVQTARVQMGLDPSKAPVKAAVCEHMGYFIE
jgi:hypothetical protein